jgi:hypothetical protein
MLGSATSTEDPDMNESLDVKSIERVTVLVDGTIWLDINHKAGEVKVIKISPATREVLLSALLPPAQRRVFRPMAISSLPFAPPNRYLSFDLTPAIGIAIEVNPDQIKTVRALLGDVSTGPARRQ